MRRSVLEGKAAVLADRRRGTEPATGPRGQGDVGQVVQHLLLRQGEALESSRLENSPSSNNSLIDLTLGPHGDPFLGSGAATAR